MTPGPMFTTAAAMLAEVDTMEKAESNRRQNRAIVSKFFNGAPPYADSEAKAIGLQMNVNNLFGYSQLAQAKGQLMAMYDKPPQFFEIQLIDAPSGDKQRWEMAATSRWNEIIKKSDRFKLAYGGLAGDCTMHGEGIPHMHTNSDWCPRHIDLSRRLVPSEAEAWAGGLGHFGLIGGIGFDEALFHLRHKSEGWNLESLKKVALRLSESEKKKNPELFPSDFAFNPEAEEYARQAGSDLLSTARLPVVYFYQVRSDLPGKPVDLVILSKSSLADSSTQKEDKEERVIYRGKCRHESVNQIITPVFMGCRLGGESLWHRILGLGHLNYSIAWHVEALMSRLMQAAAEDATMFWNVADVSARETLEQIRVKHNGIIPEGASLVENRHGSNLNGLVNVIQTLRQQGAQNSMGMASNEGQPGDVLQVQALWEQQEAMAARSTHTANWLETLARLGNEMFRRATNPIIQPCEKGYSEVLEFQAAMERRGVPLRYLQPENVKVTLARIAGDGNQQRATAQGDFILKNIQQIDPHKQPRAKRDAFAAILGDYDRAAAYIDVESKAPRDQAREAEEEDAVMFMRGSLGQEQPLDTDSKDVHEEHLIGGHFPTLTAIVSKGIQRKSTWTPEELAAFKLIGAHCVLHINVLQDMGKKDFAKAAMDQLNKISAMGAKMANNLSQQQQSNEQQPDPVAVANLQLDMKKLELQQEKFQHATEKFDRTQGLREHTAATDELLKLQRDNRDDKRTKQEMTLADIETARKVATTSAA